MQAGKQQNDFCDRWFKYMYLILSSFLPGLKLDWVFQSLLDLNGVFYMYFINYVY